jgi:hypothetical protein
VGMASNSWRGAGEVMEKHKLNRVYVTFISGTSTYWLDPYEYSDLLSDIENEKKFLRFGKITLNERFIKTINLSEVTE